MNLNDTDIKRCNYSTHGKWTNIPTNYEYVFDVYLNEDGDCACIYKDSNKNITRFRVIFYYGPANYSHIRTVDYSSTREMVRDISFKNI